MRNVVRDYQGSKVEMKNVKRLYNMMKDLHNQKAIVFEGEINKVQGIIEKHFEQNGLLKNLENEKGSLLIGTEHGIIVYILPIFKGKNMPYWFNASNPMGDTNRTLKFVNIKKDFAKPAKEYQYFIQPGKVQCLTE